MNLLIKKHHTVLILATILVLVFAEMPNAYSTETTDLDEVLAFLEDVVKLDVSKYDVEPLVTTVNNPPKLGGLTQITGKCTLQSKTSKLDVLFSLKNNTLSWCLLRVIEGSPQYSIQTSTNIRENTRDFLQRYQSYTGDTELETMKGMLDTVDTTKNATKTMDNMRITVSNTAESTSFDWKYSFNGANYMGITINLQNGSFYSFSDTMNLYTIGSTDVNVSKEEAVIFAHKYVENLKWTIGDIEVTNFTIVEEATDPELLTRTRDEPLKLYPYWYVLLYLDHLYPGNVRHIQVMFWADTGELIDCQPLSFGGGSSQQLSNNKTSLTTEQSASLSSQQNEDISIITYAPIIASATITIITIGIIVAIRKKKHK